MKKLFCKSLILSLILSITLSSCAQDGTINRQDAAGVLGAIGGGILGSNVGGGKGRMVGAAVGALAGYGFGRWMGENLDEKDRQYHYVTTQRSLENAKVGHTESWSDPDNGVQGYVTPTRTYKAEGRYCREYTQKIIIGGKEQSAYGKACRQPDGAWEIIE